MFHSLKKVHVNLLNTFHQVSELGGELHWPIEDSTIESAQSQHVRSDKSENGGIALSTAKRKVKRKIIDIILD